MAGLGVQVAIIQDGAVVLIQREDFAVWGLPGGEIDAGETPAQAAVREAYEETGLHVRLTRLVGLYTIPRWTALNATTALFAAEVIGGDLRPDSVETLDVRFFSHESLPQQLIGWHRRRIADALDGIGGSAVWTQDVPWPQDIPSRGELYRRRDESGLPRHEFFQRMAGDGPETPDVPGSAAP